MKVAWHCLCGASWTGTLPGPYDVWRQAWKKMHGCGLIDNHGLHGPADAKTAARQRAKWETKPAQTKLV